MTNPKNNTIIVPMKDFKISEHFKFYELTKSKDHPELVLENRKHFAAEPFLSRLIQSSEYLLEAIRDEINSDEYLHKFKVSKIPLMVLNGGRSPELNSVVGGAIASQHLFSRLNDGAYDITCPFMGAEALGWVIQNQVGVMWHQLRVYPGRNFCHIGMPLGRRDGQVDVIE